MRDHECAGWLQAGVERLPFIGTYHIGLSHFVRRKKQRKNPDGTSASIWMRSRDDLFANTRSKTVLAEQVIHLELECDQALPCDHALVFAPVYASVFEVPEADIKTLPMHLEIGNAELIGDLWITRTESVVTRNAQLGCRACGETMGTTSYGKVRQPLKQEIAPVDKCPACGGGLFPTERPDSQWGTLWHCHDCDWDSDGYEPDPATEVTS